MRLGVVATYDKTCVAFSQKSISKILQMEVEERRSRTELQREAERIRKRMQEIDKEIAELHKQLAVARAGQLASGEAKTPVKT